MGDFIAQIGNLGDILNLWAIKFVNKNALKAQISVFGRYFFLSLCSKVRFWAIWDIKWAIFGLVDLATLSSERGGREFIHVSPTPFQLRNEEMQNFYEEKLLKWPTALSLLRGMAMPLQSMKARKRRWIFCFPLPPSFNEVKKPRALFKFRFFYVFPGSHVMLGESHSHKMTSQKCSLGNILCAVQVESGGNFY